MKANNLSPKFQARTKRVFHASQHCLRATLILSSLLHARRAARVCVVLRATTNTVATLLTRNCCWSASSSIGRRFLSSFAVVRVNACWSAPTTTQMHTAHAQACDISNKPHCRHANVAGGRAGGRHVTHTTPCRKVNNACEQLASSPSPTTSSTHRQTDAKQHQTRHDTTHDT